MHFFAFVYLVYRLAADRGAPIAHPEAGAGTGRKVPRRWRGGGGIPVNLTSDFSSSNSKACTVAPTPSAMVIPSATISHRCKSVRPSSVRSSGPSPLAARAAASEPHENNPFERRLSRGVKGPSRLLLCKSGKSATASRGSGVAALRSPVTAKMSQSCSERGGGSAHG
jgi:hypothetical protein